MKPKLAPGTALAIVAATATVLVAWLFPFPAIVAGDEQQAPQRLPEVRAEVGNARRTFGLAREAYRDYVATHDMSALLATTRRQIADVKSNPDNLERMLSLRETALEIAGYTTELEHYARASEGYFDALRRYDDDLMAWTRSLRAGSESLRDDTWPIVEHLKLYPTPVGLKNDPPMVGPADVASSTIALQLHVAELTREQLPSGPQTDGGSILTAIEQDVENIWEAGRSVEYVAGLHDDYHTYLAVYDAGVKTQASGAANSRPDGGRLLLASALNLVLGALLVAGCAALFMPRREAK